MFILIILTCVIFSIIFMKDASDNFEEILQKVDPPKRKDENFIQENYNNYYEDEFNKAIKNIKVHALLIVVLFELINIICINLISRYFFIAIPLSFGFTLPLMMITTNMEKDLRKYMGEDLKIVKKYLILPLVISQTFFLVLSIFVKFSLIMAIK